MRIIGLLFGMIYYAMITPELVSLRREEPRLLPGYTHALRANKPYDQMTRELIDTRQRCGGFYQRD